MTRRDKRRSAAALTLALSMTATLFTGIATAPSAIAQDGIRERQYWLDEYGIRDAWKESTGAGVKVAIIDSGIDGDHPDLEGAIVGGTDVSGSGSPDGLQGLGDAPEHGTLVATLLAGRGHSPEPEPEPEKTKGNKDKDDAKGPSPEPT